MNDVVADIFNTTPSDWYKHLPFYVQDDVDQAIVQFQGLSGDLAQDPVDLFQARARGWLAYCYLVVHFDQWEKKDWNCDGAVDLGDAADVKSQAQSLVNSARGHSEKDYDIRWAYAYERLFYGDFAEAKQTLDVIFTSQTVGSDEEQIPPSESGVYAECADMYVYLGEVDEAVRRAREAISIAMEDGTRAPDWYFWTLAWALYHRAIIASKPATQRREILLTQAQRALRLMRRARTAKRFDFDALRLQAVISEELSDNWERDNCRHLYLTTKANRKGGKVWRLDDEMARSPFDTKNSMASDLRDNWEAVCSKLL